MELAILLASIVLIVASMSGKGLLNKFDISNTLALRGVLAVMIVLAHITQHIMSDLSTPLLVREVALQITGSAIYVVATFFFLSAYGLMASYRSKGEAYLSGFFHKRCQRLLTPFLLVVIVYQIYNIIAGTFDPFAIVVGLTQGDTLHLCPNTWFVLSLLIFYLMFWMVAKATHDIKQIALLLSCLTIIYTIVLFALFYFKGWGLHWFQSNLGFVSGVVICCYERQLRRIIAAHMIAVAMLLIGGLIGLWLFAHIHWVAITIACGVVPLLIYCSISRLHSTHNRVLGFLGKYSYEIYITHGVLIVMFGFVTDPICFSLIVAGMVMPFSIIVNKCSARIQNLFNSSK